MAIANPSSSRLRCVKKRIVSIATLASNLQSWLLTIYLVLFFAKHKMPDRKRINGNISFCSPFLLSKLDFMMDVGSRATAEGQQRPNRCTMGKRWMTYRNLGTRKAGKNKRGDFKNWFEMERPNAGEFQIDSTHTHTNLHTLPSLSIRHYWTVPNREQDGGVEAWQPEGQPASPIKSEML